MKIGNIVRLAHYGSLAPKEEFHVHTMKTWGLGTIIDILPEGTLAPDGSEVPFVQYEVMWSGPYSKRSRSPVRTQLAEEIEVIK